VISCRRTDAVWSLSASVRDAAGANWLVDTPTCGNCDQPQPPNVTDAIADRERYR
jgi:hypothetical protein